jgi:glycogen synthase
VPYILTDGNPVRVLHLTTEFPPIVYGGLGTALGGMAIASVQAGMTVGVLLAGHLSRGGYDLPRTPGHEGGDFLQATSTHKGVKIFYAPSYAPVNAGVRLVQLWKPDVVHLHVFWLWPVAQAIQQRTGVPLIYHVHSLDRAEYDLGDGPPECLTQWCQQQAAIHAANLVIALTDSERVLLAEYCPSVGQRVRIVGNGVTDTVGARHTLRQRSAGTVSAVVLYAGRFVERKGLRELLRAIPSVLEHAPATRFVFAGGHRDSSGQEMEQQWLPHELVPYRSQIVFTGWLSTDELKQWYSAGDVLVVPSWYEPFGMVILEGMLYGLAIVAADVGGPAEILEDQRTGILFPARDAEALADALIQLVSDAKYRYQLGVAAADEVRNRWLWSSSVRRLRDCYQEACQNKVD